MKPVTGLFGQRYSPNSGSYCIESWAQPVLGPPMIYDMYSEYSETTGVDRKTLMTMADTAEDTEFGYAVIEDSNTQEIP